MATVELLESDGNLVREQTTLVEHEAFVDDLITRINRLIIIDRSTGSTDSRRLVAKCLEHIESKLAVVTDKVAKLSFKPDSKCVVNQWEERLFEIKQ